MDIDDELIAFLQDFDPNLLAEIADIEKEIRPVDKSTKGFWPQACLKVPRVTCFKYFVRFRLLKILPSYFSYK